MELFVNSHKYFVISWSALYFTEFFVNTLINGQSIGSGFTKFGFENDKLFL